jgi:penicillin-binding protein 1B
MIDQRFKGPVFGNSARIYAVSRPVQVGEKIEPKDIAVQLRRAGYSDKDAKSPMGSYRLFEDGIEIKPGPDSYHSPESAIIRLQGGKVASITSKSGDLGAYELEPQMITSLFDAGQRSKRELVTYDEIPKLMVDAVLAIEDRRFFQHGVLYFNHLA